MIFRNLIRREVHSRFGKTLPLLIKLKKKSGFSSL